MEMKKYRCSLCGYVYNPAIADTGKGNGNNLQADTYWRNSEGTGKAECSIRLLMILHYYAL